MWILRKQAGTLARKKKLLIRNWILPQVTEACLQSPKALGGYFPLRTEFQRWAVGAHAVATRGQAPACPHSLLYIYLAEPRGSTQEEACTSWGGGASPHTLSPCLTGQNCISGHFQFQVFSTGPQTKLAGSSSLNAFSWDGQTSKTFHGLLVLHRAGRPGYRCKPRRKTMVFKENIKSRGFIWFWEKKLEEEKVYMLIGLLREKELFPVMRK